MIAAYPLTWPEGWPRTERRTRATFGKAHRGDGYRHYDDLTIQDAVKRVLAQLEHMGIAPDDFVISTNVPLRLDGYPRSDAREPQDPGTAVYWQDKQRARKVIAIDRYDRVADNLAAIAASLDALRGLKRWGGQILDRAFTGFTALPAPGQAQARSWRDIIGVDPNEYDLDRVRAAYRARAAQLHPDRGGSDDAMAALNAAWAQAETALGAQKLP